MKYCASAQTAQPSNLQWQQTLAQLLRSSSIHQGPSGPLTVLLPDMLRRVAVLNHVYACVELMRHTSHAKESSCCRRLSRKRSRYARSSLLDMASRSGRFVLTMASRACGMCLEQGGVAPLVGSALVTMLPRHQFQSYCTAVSFDPRAWFGQAHAH